MKIHEQFQQLADDPKIITTIGFGGMGLSLMDIASIAQAIGFIAGSLLVIGQLVIFCINTWNRFKKRNPANDK